MPSPIDSPSYDHLTIEENADTTRTSSGMSGAVATPPSTTGEWLRAARIARALLKRWVTPFFALQIICILIVISITPMADSYVYAGSLQLIAWGITVGFALSLTERSLLFAGATAQTIWRITIACACATTALIAIGMAICTALDIAVGNVNVTYIYIVQYTGVGPYLWLLVPLGAFPGFLASVCVGMAIRHLGPWSITFITVLTIMLMNPIVFLVISHDSHTGLLGYVSYLLVAAFLYPVLLRFILSRPRNEE